ncbi:set and mynd domain containing arthropod-specific member 4 isoform a [Holotrichia oblita]|uniref:Set and mynd domain containing arthropod-specific member 4 isoform a n=1 Tax=Holotrichia oblita TaxID=644536 RepID=A0ACB9THE2_HOLOL|nr:set and mynd domain containing arthropod-specific member 4 isoform a [Holotrichia oblita]
MCETLKRTDDMVNNYLKSREINRLEKSWDIRLSKLSGRGIFATRDIYPGEVILVDSPIIIGPRARSDSSEICVNCYKRDDLVKCSKKCGLPVCSVKCENSDTHKKECRLINTWKKEDSDYSNVTSELLRCLTPIRSLFLNENDKNLVKLLKSHSDPKHGFEVDILKEKFNFTLGEDEEIFLRFVCSVLDANAFEVVVGNETRQSALRGLYPLSSLVNHNCSPNTTHIFDNKQRMIVRATVFIAKDTEIFHSYVRIIWGTLTRRYLLYLTKHFACDCERCRDPSEFGGNLSGLKCQSCSSVALPVEPLQLKCDWKCTSCGQIIPENRIALIFSVLGSRVQNIDEANNVEEMFKFLDEKLAQLVAPTNQIAVELKYKLVWILGYSPGYLWKELSLEYLERKEAICRELLELLSRIKVGQCKMRGLLLYELYLCQQEKERRGLTEPIEINNNEDESKSYNTKRDMKNMFDEAVDILTFDVGAAEEIKNNWKKADVFDL